MKNGKKLLALTLALATVFSMLPTTALAAETNDVAIAEDELLAETEEVMPAGELVAEDINGVTVTAKYDEDTFPTGTTMSVDEMTDEKELEETTQLVSNLILSENTENQKQLVELRSFDIRFNNNDGDEVVPANGKDITIAFALPEENRSEDVEYFAARLLDSGEAEIIEKAEVNIETGELELGLEEMSNIAVATVTEQADETSGVQSADTSAFDLEDTQTETEVSSVASDNADEVIVVAEDNEQVSTSAGEQNVEITSNDEVIEPSGERIISSQRMLKYNSTSHLDGIYVGHFDDGSIGGNVCSATIDGVTYEFASDCYSAFEMNEVSNLLLGITTPQVVYQLKNNRIIKFAQINTVLKPSLSIKASPDTFIYQDGQYNDDRISAQVTVACYLGNNSPFTASQLENVGDLA